jgi:hypothetical protein
MTPIRTYFLPEDSRDYVAALARFMSAGERGIKVDRHGAGVDIAAGLLGSYDDVRTHFPLLTAKHHSGLVSGRRLEGIGLNSTVPAHRPDTFVRTGNGKEQQ